MKTDGLPPLPDHVQHLPDEQIAFYADMGYAPVLRINGEICGLQQFLYTVGIVCGMDETVYSHRFCYHNQGEALQAYARWINEGGEEPTGYIKRK